MAENDEVKVITGEFIGSADVNHTVFSGHLLEHKPVVPGSVEFTMGQRTIAEDDGEGNLIGNALEDDANNMIDYETQDYNIEVDSGYITGEERITVTYSVAENVDSVDALHEIRSNMDDQEEVAVPYELSDENIVDRLITGDVTVPEARRMLEERVIGDSTTSGQLEDLADQYSF